MSVSQAYSPQPRRAFQVVPPVGRDRVALLPGSGGRVLDVEIGSEFRRRSPLANQVRKGFHEGHYTNCIARWQYLLHRLGMHTARMREAHERLKWAREQAGFETAAAAAEAMGVPKPTYHAHENGTRGFTNLSARKYARRFGVRTPWLQHNEGPPKDHPAVVYVVGYIGAGSEITPVDDFPQGGGLEEVEAPPGAENKEILAVRVRGDSMYPAYKNGDTIYYSAVSEDPSHHIGEECVVKLTDGRMYLKLLERGSGGTTFTLLSHNAQPIYDAQLEWAAKVKWVKRR